MVEPAPGSEQNSPRQANIDGAQKKQDVEDEIEKEIEAALLDMEKASQEAISNIDTPKKFEGVEFFSTDHITKELEEMHSNFEKQMKETEADLSTFMAPIDDAIDFDTHVPFPHPAINVSKIIEEQRAIARKFEKEMELIHASYERKIGLVYQKFDAQQKEFEDECKNDTARFLADYEGDPEFEAVKKKWEDINIDDITANMDELLEEGLVRKTSPDYSSVLEEGLYIPPSDPVDLLAEAYVYTTIAQVKQEMAEEMATNEARKMEEGLVSPKKEDKPFADIRDMEEGRSSTEIEPHIPSLIDDEPIVISDSSEPIEANTLTMNLD